MVAQLKVFSSYDYLCVMSPFLCSSWCVNLIRVFLHDDTLHALVRWPPCELNISCTSTTAESRAKIWYQ